jgi:LysM repeat protein
MAHGVLLVVSIVLAGVRFSDHSAPATQRLEPIAVNAAGLVDGASGSATITMGRGATVIKPLEIPLAPTISHSPLHYTVRQDDTVAQIAQRQGIPDESVRWSNFDQLSREGSEPEPGTALLLPPLAGIALVSRQGDTISGLADRYHADATAILDFNRLRLTSDDPLPAGLELVIPAGRGPDFAPASPVSRPAAGLRGPGSMVLGPGPNVPVAAGNRFAFGNCTYYVYNRRVVLWQGDAWAWYGNAQAMGFATGRSPRPGAIMVTWESGYGHVAFVESVNADGSWVVSEMNFVAFNAVDRRLIRPGGVPLIGFIY